MLIIEEIEIEQLKEYAKYIETHDKFDMLIYSYGGDSSIEDVIYNLVKDKVGIVYIAYVGSCAFDLAYKLKDKVQVLQSAYAGLHNLARSTRIGNGGNPRGNLEKFKFGTQLKNKPSSYSFLNNKENKIIAKGGDVFLDEERLRVIFSK